MADKLLSSRNLVDGDLGPLRKFTGILDSIPTEVKSYGEGDKKKNSTQAVLNLKQLEVIEAVEPYNFPTYSTRGYTVSSRNKSRWGVLMQSFNNLVDPLLYSKEQLDPTNPAYLKPKDRLDIESCINRRIGLVLADGEEGRPKPPNLFDGRANEGKGADVPTPTLMFFMVEGIGVAGGAGISPTDKAIGLLNGRTLAEFNQKVLAEPLVRNDVALLQAISLPETAPNSFAAAMLAAGKFTKDANGVYKKVGA